MKHQHIYELEEVDLEGWMLIKETPSEKVFHKDGLEKHLEIFEYYIVEKNFKNQQLHGKTIGRMKQAFLHYPNHKSTIYLIENYCEDKQQGQALFFYDDGSRMQKEWENDQLNGKWEMWFSNGQKEKEKHFLNDEQHGEQFEWYENGQLKLVETFSNGILHGPNFQYLENGQLKRKKCYENGEIEGVVYVLWGYKEKLVDGGVYSETEYENGIPHGKEIVFYPNQIKMREGNYKKGKEEGERIWWNKNGTIAIKEYFKNGILDGDRYLYNENGQLEKVQHYEKGNQIS